MYLNRLFVYGTLLPGLANYHRFLSNHHPVAHRAEAVGIMYYLPDDDYPVVIEEKGVVKGVLFEFKNLSVVLPELDEIEKFTGVDSHSLLIREVREISHLETGEKVRAYMFFWPPERKSFLEKNGQVIEDGDWARFLNREK